MKDSGLTSENVSGLLQSMKDDQGLLELMRQQLKTELEKQRAVHGNKAANCREVLVLVAARKIVRERFTALHQTYCEIGGPAVNHIHKKVLYANFLAQSQKNLSGLDVGFGSNTVPAPALSY